VRGGREKGRAVIYDPCKKIKGGGEGPKYFEQNPREEGEEGWGNHVQAGPVLLRA